MGLFDKIKDNAKNISIRALEAAENNTDTPNTIQKPTTQQVVTPTISKKTITEESKTKELDSSKSAAKTSKNEKNNDKQLNDLENKTPKNDNEKIDNASGSDLEKKDKNDKNSINVDNEVESDNEKAIRKSKVTEVSKAEYLRQEKEKEKTKAKQEAKERLAKAYVPSYKNSTKETSVEPTSSELSTKKDNDATAKKPNKSINNTKSIGIIDVTPHKFSSPSMNLTYARERAAMTALASQRKLNGTVPIYTSSHMNFKVKVFVDRIEYSGSFGKNILQISKVAWVKLRFSGTGVVIETTDSKKVVMVVKPADRLEFADAIFKVQALQPKRKKFKDTQTIRIDQLDKLNDDLDELEKLASLFDKGIITKEEFDIKKKQILGL